MIRAIKNHVIELSMDPNGTHVVQRLLLCISSPLNDFVFNPIIERVVDVAHHPYGLCVVKKCISQTKKSGRHQEMLLLKLAEHALDLVQSPYGNYAIQHALEEWGGPACSLVLQSLEGRMMQLSIQKFSSNVVERIFCVAPPDLRCRFIDELIHSDKMSVLVNSNYGHYVVKRALQLADLGQVQALLQSIGNNLAQLPNRRMRARWEKVMSVGSQRLGDGRGGSAGMMEASERTPAGGGQQISTRGWLQPGPPPIHSNGGGGLGDLARGQTYQEAGTLPWPTNLSLGAGISAGGRRAASSLQQPPWGQWNSQP